MKRSAFLGTLIALPAVARAQTPAVDSSQEYDPATTAAVQSLRVLLGTGSAVVNPQGGFTYDGRAYRGSFVRTQSGQVVTTVGLEEYLYSVVPREMPSSWPPAALQAQAVCARSYVLRRSNPRRFYDLVPSEADQVYDGVVSETPAGSAAVDATHGQVLQYGSRVAQTVYSACCGGHTESSHDAWGGAPIAYLDGVECTYCTASTYYRWERVIALAEVAAAFRQRLLADGELKTVTLGAIDASGRARTFELVASGGSSSVNGTTFRLRVGPSVLPSLLISSLLNDATGNDLTILGGGLGHGVGLCQWGARGMALSGASLARILAFYFPGTTIGHD
jgi:stage II sporulation protein D